MADKPYNIGIIGYGAAAKVFHIPLIKVTPGFNLYAIVQRNPTPQNDASKAHPGIKSYRAAEEMVKDDLVDIVVITTTPATHFELASLALENRKPGKLLFIYLCPAEPTLDESGFTHAEIFSTLREFLCVN